ncbi:MULTISPECIES: thiol reductant ABC exporter subunit CydD [Gordonia]|uniref:Cysteine ABC transporter ATP-binding protein n=1 Tax=Gordonia alkanivorans CGMCC 6845 TaxID=1423140 RepID=W9DBI0_9ACTN|nr:MULTISPECIES: thiol reductant ABC exporter subunit CydD [Gordonia]ETA05752.1 cysteine ABC transporter ATP-binding protein [Gordonia alkanivorans CGMCC 6845]MDH3005766.1 thiol reductant ABC exporter subunit CydD [Gordonia alkanivorans]MDH3016059.1 thiol reductant ABC exporter subunit CydD [Gordonia alkanivorans]MDH3019823.1 thiol reductant ABC exporter subunit CydD [Gordonia alkanivorans]MDH3024432.1 thiol reductant ABC exporter subunit CydD [Gordonia alkanivorans]
MTPLERSAATRRGAARPPVDPRLLRYSPTTRRYVAVTAAFAVAQVIAIIVAAGTAASILSELIVFPEERSFDAQWVHLVVLAVAMAARAAMAYGHDRYAHRAAEQAIAELRAEALDVLTDPRRTAPRTLLTLREHAATVLLRGLDALGPYLSGYLPALVAAVILTPTVTVVIAFADWPSALIILITLPLIPIFMVLVGLMTRDRTSRKLATMSRLTAQLLDLIAGLPTLRALNRAEAPAAQVAELGEAHRRSTMSSLRVAFLSGAVLELLATLCVALVAVGIGLRLVFGEMSLYAGVFALILAPEAYLPLRRVGAQFHNSADGVTAAGEVFELIDSPEDAAPMPVSGGRGITVAGAPITILDLGVHGRDGWAPESLRATIAPGSLTLFTGPNGSGKSTTLAAIMGLVTPDDGSVLIGSIPVTHADPESLYEQIAWLPQQPVVVPGTVGENVELFGALDRDAADRAATASGFDSVVLELPNRLDTRLGAGGVGLSAGQRQRLALTRVLASPAPLLLLDEPTAHLDEDSERAVLTALRERARAGDTVIVVAHRGIAREFADQVVEFDGGVPCATTH